MLCDENRTFFWVIGWNKSCRFRDECLKLRVVVRSDPRINGLRVGRQSVLMKAIIARWCTGLVLRYLKIANNYSEILNSKAN